MGEGGREGQGMKWVMRLMKTIIMEGVEAEYSKFVRVGLKAWLVALITLKHKNNSTCCGVESWGVESGSKVQFHSSPSSVSHLINQYQ